MRKVALIVGSLLIVVVTVSGCGGEGSAGSDTPQAVVPATDGGENLGSRAGTIVSEETTTATTVILPEPGQESGAVRVLSVADGDTVDVSIDGRQDTVRILGINAPESGECLGEEATRRVEELVEGPGTVLISGQSPERDKYGRLLADLVIGDTSIARTLVLEGLALSVAYGRSAQEQKPLDDLQALARADQVGLWAPKACGGSGAGSVSIAHIEYDAPGNDGENLNSEWIEVTAIEDTDLTGWSIRDESSSHRYTFPDAFTLPAGDVVRIRSGCGTDTRNELFWCNEGSAIWNNSGDTGLLIDPSGSFVDQWSY